jgi:general secretion pathway protein I
MPVIRQQGFSLLEMLIAFSILAVSLGILLNIFSGGANTALVAEEYTAAVQIAESLLAASSEKTLKVGQESGIENEKYRWLFEVSPYQLTSMSADPLNEKANLVKVKVTVNWGDDEGEDRQLDLTTLKLVNKAHGAQ